MSGEGVLKSRRSKVGAKWDSFPADGSKDVIQIESN